MKKIVYKYPHSSFLSLEKDMSIIVDMMLKNNRLKKFLHYTTSDCMNKPNLTEDETLALFGKNIRIVPRFTVDKDVLNYIIIEFNNFTPNKTNPQFRDNMLVFHIVCHFDQWQLKDFELRPYKIAAEIDSMLAEQELTGIGDLEFLGADHHVLNNEFGCLSMVYAAVHGEEDRKTMPNPMDEDDFIQDFNELFNN